jgi:uncharacterized protein (DUF1778 family)
MMIATSKTKHIALRVAHQEKRRLEQAAKLQHRSLTEFVLSASREAADAVLGGQTRLVLPKEKIAVLNAALYRPPRAIPKLKALFARPSVFKK